MEFIDEADERVGQYRTKRKAQIEAKKLGRQTGIKHRAVQTRVFRIDAGVLVKEFWCWTVQAIVR